MKNNWQFKKIINVAFFRLRNFPRVSRSLTQLIYLLRLLLRAGKPPAPDNIGTVIICDELKAIYAGNPKVASSSVRSFFQALPFHHQLEIKQSYSETLQTKPELRDYYKFAFVRDPWSRVFSCWNDKVSHNKKFADIFILTRYRGLYPGMPFAEFVHWLASDEGSDLYADRHWISQYQILENESGQVKFDSLGSLSSVSKDFAKVQKELSIEAFSLPRVNQQLEADVLYLSAYTDDLIAIISKRYEKDIVIFGFKTPEL